MFQKGRARGQYSITRTMLSVGLLLMGVMASFLAFVQNQYTKVLVNEYRKNQQISTAFVADNIEQFSQSVSGYARSMMSNASLGNLIMDFEGTGDWYQENQFVEAVSKIIRPVSFSQNYIASTDVLVEHLEFYHSQLNGVFNYRDYPDEEVVDFAQSHAVSGWVHTRKPNLPLDVNDKEVITFVQSLYSSLFFGQKIGHLIINIKESALYDLLKRNKQVPDSLLILVDDDGYVLSSTDRNLQGALLPPFLHGYVRNPEKYQKVVGKARLEHDGWTLYSITDRAAILQPAIAVSRRVVCIEIGFVVVLFLVVLLISFWVSSPIKRLAKEIQDIDVDSIDTVPALEPTSIKELALVQDQFELLIKRVSQLVKDITEKEHERQKLSIDILQEQINPHFLYNTLDTINWMALSQHQKTISNMVLRLGSFLRLSLNHGKSIYTVSDEIKHVQSYIEIQQIRYQGQVSCHFHIDDSARGCRVVKILMQPFVENSFLHGFEDNPGTLDITVRHEAGTLVFIVRDDGIGIAPEVLAQLNDLSCPMGHGIKNVKKRVAGYYGKAGSVHIASVLGKGTQVTITITDTILETAHV